MGEKEEDGRSEARKIIGLKVRKKQTKRKEMEKTKMNERNIEMYKRI